MLGRILPCLWLGDEDNTRLVVPLELQGHLLAALQGVQPRTADAQVRGACSCSCAHAMPCAAA